MTSIEFKIFVTTFGATGSVCGSLLFNDSITCHVLAFICGGLGAYIAVE